MGVLIDIRTLLIFSSMTCLILAAYGFVQTQVFPQFRDALRWLSLCMLFGGVSLLGLAVTTGHLSPLRTLFGYTPGVVAICFALMCVSALYREAEKYKWALTITAVYLVLFLVLPVGPGTECWLLSAEAVLTAIATRVAWRGQEPEAPVARKLLIVMIGGYALNTAASVVVALISIMNHGIPADGSPIETTLGLLLMWAFAPLLLYAPVTTIVNARVAGRLKELADFDGLTGLKVRRRFFEESKRIIDRQANNGGHLAIMMIDLDHFKQVNDRHGHAVGDAALLHCAELIRSTTRADTLLARYGGEEFCALIHVEDQLEIDRVAERIRASIAATPLRINGVEIALTVSIGVAFHEAGQHIELLLDRADRNLYAAKHAGRNRVVAIEYGSQVLVQAVGG